MSATVEELTRRGLDPRERVLLTGASGWFGRSALALLATAMGEAWMRRQILPTATAARTIDLFGVGPVDIATATLEEIAAFRPTVVINCAFPTRDKVARLGWDAYCASASSATGRLLAAAKLPGVERVISFSSGAAVAGPKFPANLRLNPYGVLKAREERALLALAAGAGKSGVVCRAWAVSGPHVQARQGYALSGMILDALEAGRITVRSRTPVVREYASVEQAIAVALRASRDGSGAFDTGGERVEVEDLARRIGAQLGVPVGRPEFDPGGAPDAYFPWDGRWYEICDRYGIEPFGLDRQVGLTIPGVQPFAGTVR